MHTLLFRSIKYLVWIGCFTYSTYSSFGQLCDGAKGDTVAYNNFTTGRWFGDVESAPVKGMLPLFQHRTDYFCPPDYTYCITNQSYGCNNGSWYDVPSDHTPGDDIGRFLLIAGSTSPAPFYKDTYRNLKGNTSYELSFWFLNLYHKYNPPLCSSIGGPVKPDLTLIAETLNGTELARFRTGPLEEKASLEWSQLGLSFTLPAGETAVVIKMENNATGNCGNDFAIDDWLIQECTPSSTLKTGFKNSTATSDTITLCFSESSFITLTEKSDPLYADPRYQWQQSFDNGLTWIDITNAILPTFTTIITQTGNSMYRLGTVSALCNPTASCRRVYSNKLLIIAVPGPSDSISANSPVCTGNSILLKTTGGINYKWTGPNEFSSTAAKITIPNATMAAAGTYFAEITNNKCITFDSVDILVEPAPDANAGPDKTIVSGGSVVLNGSSTTKGGIYSWTPAQHINDPTNLTPLVNPPAEMVYTLTVGTEKGCGTASDSVRVSVLGDVTIPNTFTPNGDGINDTWTIKGLSAYTDCQVNIYNRYGQLIFFSKGYNAPWNGSINARALPIGTYYYLITLSSNSPQALRGSITIIR